jgi:F0F1-type ATP synthase alpha subunit
MLLFHIPYTKEILKKNFFIKNPSINKNGLLFSGKILSKYDGIIQANGLYNVKLGEIVYVIKTTKNNKIEGNATKNNVSLQLYGLVFNLTKNEVGIMFFGSTKSISVWHSIFRSRK